MGAPFCPQNLAAYNLDLMSPGALSDHFGAAGLQDVSAGALEGPLLFVHPERFTALSRPATALAITWNQAAKSFLPRVWDGCFYARGRVT